MREQKIMLCSSGDEGMIPLDTEELQVRLIRAFLSCGRDDTYLSEDLILALEYALERTADVEDGERRFSQAALEELLCRMLSDAGLPEVAAEFRNRELAYQVAVHPERLIVETLLARQLELQDPLLSCVVEQTMNALEVLKVKQAAPALVVELGRHFHNQALPDWPVVSAPEWKQREPLEFVAGEFDELWPELWKQQKIISFKVRGRFFQHAELGISLVKLASLYKWEAPVTELLTAAELYSTGDIIRPALKRTGMLPLTLVIPDLPEFCCKYLELPYPEGERTVLDLLEPFFSGLGCRPFKLKIR